MRKISISSDHAGFRLKESIKKFLIKKKFLVLDLGPRDDRSVDYPDYAKKLAKNIISKKSDTGILVCGSGIGMAMSANRFKKIRAAVCYNVKSTKLSRSHNNANIIAIGSRLTNKNLALKLVMIFLKTKFDGGRHKRRTNKI
ncbi:MAG: ribose 5-phosphate isomerase B [Pelagibacteraceae bacterium]|nr:ribose 5-phosphate isomerase B [Pelagibacteraceae bacterium]